MKSRALFVLAQSHSPQAEALISQIAQGQSGPALQIKAIRMLAAAQGKRADDNLASIYQHTSDVQVKRVILQSYLVTGDSVEAARSGASGDQSRTGEDSGPHAGRDERGAGSADACIARQTTRRRRRTSSIP